MNYDPQNIADTVGKANAAALETAKALTAINARVADKLAKQQLELVGEALNGGVRQLKLLSTTKGYSDYLTAQAELAQEAAEKIATAARESLTVIAEARDELTNLVAKGVDTATAELKSVPAKKSA
jgi:phasin family protein